MSLWEIAAIAKAIARFHGGGEEVKPLSDEEHDRLMAKHG